MVFNFGQYEQEILNTVLENAFHCIVIVDRDGVIMYMNKTYCDFLEVNKQDVTGRHVTDIIENSRMHIVVKTGKEEIADLQYIRGNYMIANRIPIYSKKRVIGAVGTVLFREMKEWHMMNSHIKELLLKMEYYRKQMKDENGAVYSLHDLIGRSEKMQQLKEKIKKVSSGNVSILIKGESGTGKELIAHSIHQLSERSVKPFITVNCAAIPEHLLESELFGYEEGAFTGAKKGGKLGKFELANGGTLFLDEIGDMPLSAQVKILRVLQEGELETVGANRPKKIDVRMIAATNQTLEKLIAKKKFRKDLFYRINVIQIDVPPLRERTDDIRLLAKYFLHKITKRVGKRVNNFDPQVMDRFKEYQWPGNIRELENVIEAAVYLTDTETICLADLPDDIKTKADNLLQADVRLKEIMEKTEQDVIRTTLSKVNGDKLKAAKRLGISKSSFYDKLKKYHLDDSRKVE